MSKYEQAVSITSANPERSLAIAYETFRSLGWDIQYAGTDSLVGKTPENRVQNIVVTVQNNLLTVNSESTNNNVFSSNAVNKKNTAAFIAAFQKNESAVTEDKIEENKSSIDQLRQATVVAAEQSAKEAEEIHRAIYRKGNSYTVTYIIIALNVLVFILMAFDGAGIIETNNLIHIKWGSNFTPLTLSGDWWRLITNTFIHFGIIHIVMNMFTFYQVGVFLEPMLGKLKFAVAYLCTGIIASLTSLWWHTEGTNSAGASGAVFGMYGLFLALLITDLIPKKVRDGLLKSIGIFVVYNLAYGVKGGIDNAAHIGGLISGFAIGGLYILSIKSEEKGRQLNWILPVVIIFTIGISYSFLSSHKADPAQRNAIYAELKNADDKDARAFNNSNDVFAKLEDSAVKMMNNNTITNTELRARTLKFDLPPLWQQADSVLSGMQKMNVNESQKKRVGLLLEYVDLRKKETELRFKLETGENTEDRLNVVVAEIEALIKKLNHAE